MLEVNFAGLKFKNPFVIAAGPSSCDPKIILRNLDKIAEAGWAGVVLKSIRRSEKERGQPTPFLFSVAGRKGRIGIQNRGPGFPLFSEIDLRKIIEAGKERGLQIITSVIAETGNIDDWASLASEAEGYGAEIVELDLSCPIFLQKGSKAEKTTIALNPQLSEEVVRIVKSKCNIPIIAKLSPNLADLSPMAEAVEKGGASGITAVNTLFGLNGIDIETGIPLCATANNYAVFAGLSGEVLKPVGLRCVTQITRSVELPVFGMGGISNWQSAVEYLMVGATGLQVCTAVMLDGFKVVTKFLKGLTDFMERKGYKSIDDFRGISLKYIVDDLSQFKHEPVIATVDETKCNGCGLCVTACDDGSDGGIITLKDKMAIIDGSLCVGCGLCKIVCPLNAIEYRVRI